MKHLWRILLLFALLFPATSYAQLELLRGRFDAPDCGALSNPASYRIACWQTDDLGGRDKGYWYGYNGKTWYKLNAVDFADLVGTLTDAQVPDDITVNHAGTADDLTFDVASQAELDAHTGDTADAHDAAAVSFAPNGSIAASDVQAAIQEVRDEALALAGGTMTGQLVLGNLGVEFPPSDTNPPCSAGNYNIYSDASESTLKMCVNGSASVVGAGSSVSLDGAFDIGKTIDGANSLANAVRIGDGTTPMCHYTDGSLGPLIRPCTDANTATIIPTNFNWSLYDIEAGAAVETVDPDAASPLAMYTYGTAYKPRKSVFISAGNLFGDGTQCPSAPSTVTINSGAPRQTFICTDNDAATLYGETAMPDAWDGGTITVKHHYIQTAADTSALNGDIAAACRLAGATINNTWGTEVAIDDAAVTGSSALDITESGAVTPNGTCTAGSSRLLQLRYQLDATGTTTAVATLHHVGFMVEYTVTSRSD